MDVIKVMTEGPNWNEINYIELSGDVEEDKKVIGREIYDALMVNGVGAVHVTRQKG